MHDEHPAPTQHFFRMRHQKIKVDIFGEISGRDAIKFSVQNHFFRSSMNKFDVGQLEIPGLFSGNVQIFLLEFDADNAALGKKPRDFESQNASAAGLLDDQVRCFRYFMEDLAFPPTIKPQGGEAGDLVMGGAISRKKLLR